MFLPFQKHLTPSSFSDISHPVGSWTVGSQFLASIRGWAPEELDASDKMSSTFYFFWEIWLEAWVSSWCFLFPRIFYVSEYYLVFFKWVRIPSKVWMAIVSLLDLPKSFSFVNLDFKYDLYEIELSLRMQKVFFLSSLNKV